MYNLEQLKPIIEKAIQESLSMREAASKTSLNFKTFRKYAKKLELYSTNPSGKGKSKKHKKIPILDIISGKYPQYNTFKLAKRLIEEGYFKEQCVKCKNISWNNLKIPLELDHIDGNPYNHNLENLRFLCPNCHAQTPTHRGKNKHK